MIGPCFDLTPNRTWLFALTHPDDELAIAAWIRRLAQSGNPVYLSWTHHTPIREQEARRFADLVGVSQKNLFFHGATDGRCPEEMPTLVNQFKKMLDEIQPDRIVAGAFEQGHRDHDATNCALHFAGATQVLEFPLYYSYLTRLQRLNRFSDPKGEELIELTEEEKSFKIQAARGYPSQTIWSILVAYEFGLRLQGRGGELLQAERMRWQWHRDFSIPNAPAKLRKRIEHNSKWQTWLGALVNLKATDS